MDPFLRRIVCSTCNGKIKIWRSCEFSKIRYDTASREYIKAFIKQENRVLARKRLGKIRCLSLFRKNTAHEGGRTREQNRTIVQRERERKLNQRRIEQFTD
jgi:hypothetical protein